MEEIDLNILLSNKLPLIKMPKTGNMIHFVSFSNILTNPNGSIIDSINERIKRVLDDGDYVIPVTARPSRITKILSDKLGINTWVAYGGGTICIDGQIVVDKLIETEIVKQICELAKDNGMAVISDKDGIITSDNPENIFARYEAAIFSQSEPIQIFDLNDDQRKIILIVPNEFRRQVANFPGIIKSKLIRILGDDHKVAINNLSIAITHASRYIEITAAHKSYGISVVRDKLNIPFDRTSGTGCSGDDVDLWDSVAFSIAMNFTPSMFSKDVVFKASSFAEVLDKLS